MKKVLFIIFAAFAFMACSNDDDENNNSGNSAESQLIVGTWQQTKVEGWMSYLGEKETWENLDSLYQFVFNEDFTAVCQHGGIEQYSFSWKYNNPILTRYNFSNNAPEDEMEITSLTSTGMEWVLNYVSGDYESYDHYYFNKK